MAYAVQSDLEIALGGAERLRQLCDFGGTGDLASAGCQAVITEYLEIGAARVRGIIEVKYEPEVLAALDSGSARLLKEFNVALSARLAWERGAAGQAVPEHVEDRAKRAEADLDRIAAGTLRLGRSSGGTAAALGQPVTGAHDHDPLRTGWSVDAFKEAGFR